MTIARSSISSDGYLAQGDFATFAAKVNAVGAGAGIAVGGPDAQDPLVGVIFGAIAGTVAQGNDPRLFDQRDPLPGSGFYVQNQTAASQPGSFNIAGSGTMGGDADIGGNANVIGNANITGNALVTGSASVLSNHSVAGTSTVSGNQSVGGSSSVAGTLSVAKDANVAGKLSVTGPVNAAGSVAANNVAVQFGLSAATVEATSGLTVGKATQRAPLTVYGPLNLKDGTEGLGKMLVSDANGFSTWQNFPTASSTNGGSLSAADYAAFAAKISSVAGGPGIAIGGADPQHAVVNAIFGQLAGTIAQGNDPRLSDQRDPKPGSAAYVQNQTATLQPGSFKLAGSGSFGGDANVGGNANVVGSAIIQGNEAVKGVSAVGGNQTVGGSSSVTGDQTVGGNSNIAGAAIVGGSLTVDGGVLVGGTLQAGALAASSLALQGDLSSGSLEVDGGVTIGSTAQAAPLTLYGPLTIQDGSQGAGKVLTSDGNGFSSWQAPPVASSTSGGTLSASDYAAFKAKVSTVTGGSGISISGADPQHAVVDAIFGALAGTVAQGNDPRLSDQRDPKPGSGSYVQNQNAVAQPGSFRLAGSGSFGGDANVGGNENVTGHSSVAGNQYINGLSSVAGSQTIGGDSLVKGSQNIGGAASVHNSLAVGGNVSVAGTASVVGALSSASVTTTALSANTASVSGAATVGGAATFGNDVAIAGTLAGQAANLAGALTVGTSASPKPSTLTGAVTIGNPGVPSALSVYGAVSMFSNVAISGALSTGSSLSVAGPTALSRSLSVNGTVTMASAVSMAGPVTEGSTTVNGSLVINGPVSIRDNTQAAGRLLTSDGAGNASWQPPQASVPAGTVSFFNLGSCPNGWVQMSQATGRVIVGVAPGYSIGGQMGTQLGDMENRAHSHYGADHTHNGYTDSANPIWRVGYTCCGYGSSGWYVEDTMTDETHGSNHNHSTHSYGADRDLTTSPNYTSNVIPYLQLLVCQKT
jgi:NDP-sugar pyrophosphorylase family protein